MSPVATATDNGHANGTPKELPGVAFRTSSKTKFPRPPKFDDKLEEREYLKFRLAQAFRIFGHLGFDEGVAGHITVRDPIKTDCFWVNPFGLHFSLIQPSDLLLVDHDCNILEESGPVRLLNTAAFMIHSEIHAARPDVNCAAHSHSIFGRAFSAFGRELDMITQDSCQFYKDHAVYTQFKGVVLDKEEGKHIAKALGSKKAVILQNHGLLTVSPTIEATVLLFITLEKCCHVQLLADAAAAGRGQKPVVISEEECESTFSTVGTLIGAWFAGVPEFQKLEKKEGVRYQFKDPKLAGPYHY